MRAPEFEASLMEAKLYPQLWRLGLGILFILFFYVAVSVAVVAAIVALANLIDPAYTIHVSAGLRSLQTAVGGFGGLDSPIAVILLLATFLGLFLGPMMAAAAFHFRGPGSLFGDRREWARGFGTALAVQLPILAVLSLVGMWIDPPQANLAFSRWLFYLPLALPLIFIQSGAEELLFRGYLQQQLAARFAARWVWMVLPAALFAALHWSPQAGDNLPVVLASAFAFGLIAADLTEQTGSLGAAMGLHFGNNLFGMLVLSIGDTVTGLALYVSPDPVGATGMQTLAMIAGIAIMLGVWRLTRYFLTR